MRPGEAPHSIVLEDNLELVIATEALELCGYDAGLTESLSIHTRLGQVRAQHAELTTTLYSNLRSAIRSKDEVNLRHATEALLARQPVTVEDRAVEVRDGFADIVVSALNTVASSRRVNGVRVPTSTRTLAHRMIDSYARQTGQR
jgi:hypothetical protein